MHELLTITPVSFPSAEAITLSTKLDRELAERYPGVKVRPFALTGAQITAEDGVFLLARAGSEPVGCGALQRLDAHTGEIRRMYVKPSARGQGLGHRLLAELERYALDRGIRRLILSTGARQPEAIHLYERCGFSRVGSSDARTHVNVYMAKSLCVEGAA
jgi:putative acetyltransferase